MTDSKGILVLLAVVTFLASLLVAVRGNFVFPVELFLLVLLGLLLVVTISTSSDSPSSSMLYVSFFVAALANVAYLYSVSGYMSTVRIGTLGLAAVGLLLSISNLFGQPVPRELVADAHNLAAAEKKIADATKKLESVNVKAKPAANKKRSTKKKSRKKK
jgi:small-conductance mechanosensitive channel